MASILASCIGHPEEEEKEEQGAPTSVLKSIENTIDSPPPAAVGSRKRKRPPKLEIPSVLEEVSTVGSGGGESVGVSRVVSGGEGWGVFSIRGKAKKAMEDSYKVVPNAGGDPKKGFFGVFDGHGGRKAAKYAAENLHGNILEMLENEDVGKEEAIRGGFLKTDQDFLNQRVNSGSCCVIALIDQEGVTVSNLGDCRAVLCRGGVAEALTTDHNAKRTDELKRIQDKGGFVEYQHGTWRVQGILAVTRSIGDGHLKEYVSAEPDTVVLSPDQDMEFIILASDGLWDKVSNQEAVDVAAQFRLDLTNVVIEHDKTTRQGEEQFSKNTSPLSMLGKTEWEREQVTNQVIGENKQEVFGCENTSPPSKIQKVDSNEKIRSCKKEQFDYENTSPHPMLAKAGRERQQEETKTPILHQVIVKDKNKVFGCENRGPSSTTQKFDSSEMIRSCKKTLFGCENTSPLSMLGKPEWEQQQETMISSPNQETDKDKQKGFSCENASPPSDIPEVSCNEKQKTETPWSDRDAYRRSNSRSKWLERACERLAGIATSKGSKDDITVMIIDLKHFISI